MASDISKRPCRVGVIGGGPAGASCARMLSEHIDEVIVFDKGRGPGGRLSTRRYKGTQFDHGAQYMTARNPSTIPMVQALKESGVLAQWDGIEVNIEPSGTTLHEPREPRLVGLPGMNGLVRYLLKGLDVRFQARATKLSRIKHQVEIALDALPSERFDIVVLAVPGPQATALLEGWPELAKQAATIRYAPCWATMVQFSGTSNLAWSAARVGDPYLPAQGQGKVLF